MAEKKTSKSTTAKSSTTKAPKSTPKPLMSAGPVEKDVHRHIPQLLSAAQFASARALPAGAASALAAHAGNVRMTDREWRLAWNDLLNKHV